MHSLVESTSESRYSSSIRPLVECANTAKGLSFPKARNKTCSRQSTPNSHPKGRRCGARYSFILFSPLVYNKHLLLKFSSYTDSYHHSTTDLRITSVLMLHHKILGTSVSFSFSHVWSSLGYRQIESLD